MAIDAIVANMDHAWSALAAPRDPAERNEQGDAIKGLLQRIRDDGYPLLLVSDMNAESLNSVISDALGEDGITWFSAILASQPCSDRYAIAVHTLETSPHRVMALGSSEHELAEARAFGIAHCVHLNDALLHASP
ncbi:hypothetical protein EVC45_41855 [Paraburkholderia sp. UYCP14C]|uniref:hypothetical protein n=1 Tax=Paraburkholderia sp. UYCP14C TaxID=2511130 RepID=UPI0010213FA5|nr:hypothetical protein [Paraburkholderia sp. UYCP14C]RZF23881.1 hypothetical protein EVC45_41855 [Paraburkholderia sp. UYCP14C]